MAETVVVSQPRFQSHSAGSEKPPTYLPLSIFSCLCCFWPVGLIAILYSNKVDSAWGLGDHEAAQKYSRTALISNVAAIVLGVLSLAVSGVILGLRISAGTDTTTTFN